MTTIYEAREILDALWLQGANRAAVEKALEALDDAESRAARNLASFDRAKAEGVLAEKRLIRALEDERTTAADAVGKVRAALEDCERGARFRSEAYAEMRSERDQLRKEVDTERARVAEPMEALAPMDWLDDLEAKHDRRGEAGAAEAYEIAADAAMPRLIEIAQAARDAEAEWRRSDDLLHVYRGVAWDALVRALEVKL